MAEVKIVEYPTEDVVKVDLQREYLFVVKNLKVNGKEPESNPFLFGISNATEEYDGTTKTLTVTVSESENADVSKFIKTAKTVSFDIVWQDAKGQKETNRDEYTNMKIQKVSRRFSHHTAGKLAYTITFVSNS